MSINDTENALINPATPLFSNNVEEKIPSVITDISEAGKCMGYGRSTAGVFHLMRAMEAGLQRLGDKLSIELTEQKVWQVILDQVNAAIKKLPPKDSATVKFAEIAAQLYHIKLAWRNEVMHPKATYTEEEANGIFGAVRSFMRDLAEVL